MKGITKWPIVLVAAWRLVVATVLGLLVSGQDQAIARECAALVERLLAGPLGL